MLLAGFKVAAFAILLATSVPTASPWPTAAPFGEPLTLRQQRWKVGPLELEGGPFPVGHGDTVNSVVAKFGPGTRAKRCFGATTNDHKQENACGQLLKYRDRHNNLLVLEFWGGRLLGLGIKRNGGTSAIVQFNRIVQGLDQWKWDGVTILDPHPPERLEGCGLADPNPKGNGWGCAGEPNPRGLYVGYSNPDGIVTEWSIGQE